MIDTELRRRHASKLGFFLHECMTCRINYFANQISSVMFSVNGTPIPSAYGH